MMVDNWNLCVRGLISLWTMMGKVKFRAISLLSENTF